MSDIMQNTITDKLRGGYYTPSKITEFICRWAIQHPDCKILEPSCGDGNFVEAATKRLLAIGLERANLNGQISAIELIESEAYKARDRVKRIGLPSQSIRVDDFFNFILTNHQEGTDKKYDVVIGNPPFIRYQNFPEEHRSKAIALMNLYGLSPNKLTNIWIPFLVVSASVLSPSGRLGMVIPAELFQVKYAAETRVFLSNIFDHLTIVTFKKLVFENIQQEVVLILGEKKSDKNKGVRVLELNNIDDLDKISLESVYKTEVKSIDHSNEKWTKYFLSQEEINLLRSIKERNDIKRADNILNVDVGIVTGKNNFFMLNSEQVRHWNLEAYTQPVVSRSPHLKGITFTNKDFADNLGNGHTAFLFLPPNIPFEDLPNECKKYIQYGESMDFQTGYKCRIRKRWYITPSLWVPEAFALRQINGFPKLILNGCGASSTDTIHRVRFKTTTPPKTVAVSFLNSLTFAYSEITGRSYGGGVMTFEPTEIEELPLPILLKDSVDFDRIDGLMRKKAIEEVLDIVDQELLIKHYCFSKKEVLMLRNIWKKLAARRAARRQ